MTTGGWVGTTGIFPSGASSARPTLVCARDLVSFALHVRVLQTIPLGEALNVHWAEVSVAV